VCCLIVLQCVAVCCSVYHLYHHHLHLLQCVSVLQCIASVCCSVLQFVLECYYWCVAVCCLIVLQHVAVCCSVLQCVPPLSSPSTTVAVFSVCCFVWFQCDALWCSELHCVAVCCSVLQCAAVCCRVLPCAAVCYIVLFQCDAVRCILHTYTYVYVCCTYKSTTHNATVLILSNPGVSTLRIQGNSTPKHTATHTATDCNILQHTCSPSPIQAFRLYGFRATLHSHTLQHTLQRITILCNILQH